MKKILSYFLCGALIVGCGMSNLGKGSLIGTGAGAAIGAGIGYLIGGSGKAAAIGAGIGTAVGAGTGAIIGHQMDKKAAELAALENAQVETVTDVNGLKAIKVTFDSGILFDFNKSSLKPEAKESLDKFAAKMADMSHTNINVYGHNLTQKGIAKDRIVADGLSFDFPVADNATAEGRAQNRRVEIYVSADEEMVKEAEAGRI